MFVKIWTQGGRTGWCLRGVCCMALVAASLWMVGCATSETAATVDPYGPLSPEQEEAYLREMAVADAFVRPDEP